MPHPTRTDAVNYYSRVAKFFKASPPESGIEFKLHSRVLSVRKTAEGSGCFILEVKHEALSGLSFISADRVIVATGFYDNPNLLSVPGEDLPSVSHYYKGPGIHFGEKVVVVGGNNSAVEAALDLYRHGVDVTILHRGERFGKGVKYWILPDIENRVKNGEIVARFGSKVLEITPGKIIG